VDARTRPATPVEPLGWRESDERRVKEEACGGMRCIDLTNRAWPDGSEGDHLRTLPQVVCVPFRARVLKIPMK